MQSHPNSATKRQVAAYYTPEILSTILADNIIHSSTDTILEPSFGGGGMLSAAISRLESLGALEPERQLFGCDIDEHAFENLPLLVGKKIAGHPRRFFKEDFLSLHNNSFLVSEFDVVLANPPYIGYHSMSSDQRVHSNEIQKHFDLKGSRCAGTWYFFLLKCLMYLKENGRIAFVLPYALIDSKYAATLRAFIGKKFRNSAVYMFSNRMFIEQGTKERVVVLMAEGWSKEGSYNNHLDAVQVNDFTDFKTKLHAFNEKGNFGKKYLGSKVGRVKGKISNSDINFINTYMQHPSIARLGDYLDIKIGLVAGDVDFFTLSKEKYKANNLNCEKHLTPIMRSLRNNKGLTFTHKDFNLNVEQGLCSYLLKYSENIVNGKYYKNYLDSYDHRKIKDNKTFNKREIWCSVDDGKIPEFFLSYMCMSGPRLVFNAFNANCLNNTHRGYAKSRMSSTRRKLLCISMLTSFSQAVVELEAKLYGNSTLKLEPNLYNKLPVLLPPDDQCVNIIKTFNSIDKMLRAGDSEGASIKASLYLYELIFGAENALGIDLNFRSIRDKARMYRII